MNLKDIEVICNGKNLKFLPSRYSDNFLCLRTIDSEGNQNKCITMKPKNYEFIDEREFVVKTWFENKLIYPQLCDERYFEDTGKRLKTNFGDAEVWRVKNDIEINVRLHKIKEKNEKTKEEIEKQKKAHQDAKGKLLVKGIKVESIKLNLVDMYNKIYGKKLKDREEVLDEIRRIEEGMMRIWYESEYTDYSFYNTKEYLSECLLSYFMNSEASIKNLLKFLKAHVKNYNELKYFDDYNGIGLTTIQLSNFGLDTYFYNDNTMQENIMKDLYNEYNIELPQHDKNRNGKYDVVISLEVMEHFESPMEYLEEITEMLSVDGYLTFAASFSPKSPIYIGHFEEYKYNKKKISKRKISKIKNDFMKKHYERLFTGWNGKPVVFKRIK